MAAQAFTASAEEDLTCPICFETFTEDHIPKDLQCPHVICQVCLEKMPRTTDGCVSCPECRTISRIPSGRISKLKTNLKLRNLAEKHAQYLEDLEKARGDFMRMMGGSSTCQRDATSIKHDLQNLEQKTGEHYNPLLEGIQLLMKNGDEKSKQITDKVDEIFGSEIEKLRRKRENVKLKIKIESNKRNNDLARRKQHIQDKKQQIEQYCRQSHRRLHEEAPNDLDFNEFSKQTQEHLSMLLKSSHNNAAFRFKHISLAIDKDDPMSANVVSSLRLHHIPIGSPDYNSEKSSPNDDVGTDKHEETSKLHIEVTTGKEVLSSNQPVADQVPYNMTDTPINKQTPCTPRPKSTSKRSRLSSQTKLKSKSSGNMHRRSHSQPPSNDSSVRQRPTSCLEMRSLNSPNIDSMPNYDPASKMPLQRPASSVGRPLRRQPPATQISNFDHLLPNVPNSEHIQQSYARSKHHRSLTSPRDISNNPCINIGYEFGNECLEVPNALTFLSRSGMLAVADNSSSLKLFNPLEKHAFKQRIPIINQSECAKAYGTWDMCETQCGNLVLSDSVTNTVTLFNIKTEQSTVVQFEMAPRGVACDKNNIYVCDAKQECVQIFTEEGLHKGYAAKGLPGGFSPTFIAVTNSSYHLQEQIAITDTENNRVYKLPDPIRFRSNGQLQPVRTIFKCPRGLMFDVYGRLYVTDQHRLQIFDRNLSYIGCLGSENSGTKLGEFHMPKGLSVGQTGRELYVCDSRNNRIQAFSLNPINRQPLQINTFELEM